MKTQPNLYWKIGKLMFLAMLALLLFNLLGQPERLLWAQEGGEQDTSLQDIFTQAATEFYIPLDLLIAISWSRSHIRYQISDAGEYGLMQLPTLDPDLVTQAARLLGETDTKIKTDNRQNVRGTAALLAKIRAEKFPDRTDLTPTEWYDVLISFSFPDNPVIAENYAQQVFKILSEGLTVLVDGESLLVNVWPEAQKLLHNKSDVTIASNDYPAAYWVAAHPSNYTEATRNVDQIDMIVIHLMQGYYASTINSFTEPKNASAHYFIRSSDGDITQMVRDEDIAWQAGHWETNQRSIGLEHEGFVNDPSWYTETMYKSSANLVRHLADKYNIPKNRAHIIGHIEVPGCPYSGGGKNCHTDPGPHWDWDHFMELVNHDTYTISGQVTAKDSGDPISGVTISTDKGQTTTSAENGKYEFNALAAGDYTLTPAKKENYTFSPVSRTVTLPSDAPDQNFSGSKQPPDSNGTLIGLIYHTKTEQRIAGVEVTATCTGDQLITDARGFYHFENLPPGTCQITASKDGYLDNFIAGRVIAGETRWASFGLNPTTDLTGTLIGLIYDVHTGERISQAALTACNNETVESNLSGFYDDG